MDQRRLGGVTDIPPSSRRQDDSAHREALREERLLAFTVAEGSLSLLVTEEMLRRERLVQLRRHEVSLAALSAASSTRVTGRDSESRTPQQRATKSLHVTEAREPLLVDAAAAADELSDEDVERLWQREKRVLELHIQQVSERVRRLQRGAH
ncbi:hypothetical protein NESM_000353500 [Novymonas esmeraldas]|uniref:Uncharacterized protein n=1 Tax=Novymonas esmeraldas TaxID=1808958 RepID=A0AAW0EN88_9TRYP